MNMYEIEVSQSFKANQGLKSPVRAAEGLAPITTGSNFEVVLRVGIQFQEDQLTARGWFVDTDAVEKQIEAIANYLAGTTWTELFEFRPTFELLAKWVYEKLSSDVPQLAYVELDNITLGVKTRYVAM
jgi:hypothetical protein